MSGVACQRCRGAGRVLEGSTFRSCARCLGTGREQGMGRTASGALTTRARPREPLLVREAPKLLRRGTELTDGMAGYRVVDHARRMGVDHYRLVNVERPELSEQPPHFGWFSVEDMAELAFGRGERKAEREEF